MRDTFCSVSFDFDTPAKWFEGRHTSYPCDELVRSCARATQMLHSHGSVPSLRNVCDVIFRLRCLKGSSQDLAALIL